MAAEQFSLCWDNFHKNMSSGMNALLENEDLVDVTLAVEGKYLKAHKMVLSVCSPYFKELFKVNPCKHPIVFMKDVSYSAMADLLQFMYQGEVQVSQDNLTTFIKTAEALQIKGLTGDGNGSNESDSENVVDEPSTKFVSKPAVASLSRPKPKITTSQAPSAKRQRISAANESAVATTSSATKPESNISSIHSSELVQFKMEPYDQTHSAVSIPDDNDDNYTEDPLDDTADLGEDTTEEYSMMEGVDDEPQAGTSADGSVGEGQVAEDIAADQLFPAKSKQRYEKEFQMFDDWRVIKQIRGVNEDILLKYFRHLEKNFKPSTLWTKYSMLRSSLNVFEHVDISRFSVLTNYLKEKIKGFRAKKSNTLEMEHIKRFLVEASDDQFILLKVILIFGVSGACSCDELCRLNVQDIEDKGAYLSITVADINTHIGRRFLLVNEGFGMNVLDIYKKYISLRPKNLAHSRFFLTYRNYKCTVQPVGVNTIAAVPKKVATYLHLADPDHYTGHAMRRSSATLLVNAGAGRLDLKRLGGWKSSSMVEEESVTNKIGITKKIMMTDSLKSSMSISGPDITNNMTGGAQESKAKSIHNIELIPNKKEPYDQTESAVSVPDDADYYIKDEIESM